MTFTQLISDTARDLRDFDKAERTADTAAYLLEKTMRRNSDKQVNLQVIKNPQYAIARVLELAK